MNSPSGRERLGPVDQADGLHVLERRHAPDRVLEQRLEARPVLLEQLAVEVGGNAVERPRRRIALVAAHDQAARLGPEVDEERRVAHGRHVGRQAARPRDQVLVRHRHDRDVDACERADLAREHAARVHDDLGLDRAAVGLDARDPAALDADPRRPSSPSGSRRRAGGRPRRARRSAGSGRCSRRWGCTRRRARRRSTSAGRARGPPRRRRARARARTSSPSPPAGRSLPSAPPTTPAAASRPRASPSPAPPPRRACGTARRSSSSSSSG